MQYSRWFLFSFTDIFFPFVPNPLHDIHLTGHQFGYWPFAKHTYIMDQAAEYLSQVGEFPPMSPAQEKRLLRKMDWILVPMVSTPD
jgi:hypothetical protein